MEILEEMRDGVAVLTVSGAMNNGPEVAGLHEWVRRLVDDGTTRIVVDFTQTDWFGSAMLGVMAASTTTLWKLGGDMRLAGANDRIKRILELSRMDAIFQCMDSVDLAVESFRRPPDVV